jgi:hypothetical protein
MYTKDDEKIASFVLRNTGYYQDKWEAICETPGSIVSFNLAAGLGQLFWLAYRKLYVPLFWTIVVSVAYVSLWLYVDDRQLLSAGWSDALSWFVCLLFFAAFGLLGNYLYWRKFRKVERQAAARHSDRASQLHFIQAKGGTSPTAASVVVVVLLLPVVWALYWGVYQASRVDYSAFVFDATGPLTLAEVQSNFFAFMDEPLEGETKECVFKEVEEQARAAGDPEMLNPATIEFLPVDHWDRLDADGKRIILTQAITTKAFLACRD